MTVVTEDFDCGALSSQGPQDRWAEISTLPSYNGIIPVCIAGLRDARGRVDK